MRNSGVVSTTMFFPRNCMQIDVRERRLYLFDEVHTGHLQPISGTPGEPPVPRNVIDKSIVRIPGIYV